MRAYKIFYPATSGAGKWHTGCKILGTATCAPTVVLDRSQAPIHVTPDQAQVHPLICRRCLSQK